MQHRSVLRAVLASSALIAPLWAHAQVTMKADGQWRSLFTAGASLTGGNTDQKSYSLSADVIKLTDHDKIALNGGAQYATSEGDKTADHANATALYTRDITPVWFGFGQLDFLRDPLTDIRSRTTTGGGVGYHVIRTQDHSWDISTGLAYTWDRYDEPQIIDDQLRTRYNHLEVLLAEESNHKFTDTTTFKQKLTVYPSLRDSGGVRTVFDAGVSVAMSQRLALTATFEHRYDSKPAEDQGKSDTQLITGISVRFD